MPWLRPGDDLDPVAVAAPPAHDLVDLLLEDLDALDLGSASEVDVPELPRACTAYDVESGEVAAVSAPPPVVLVGERECHGPTLANATQTTVDRDSGRENAASGRPSVSQARSVVPRA